MALGDRKKRKRLGLFLELLNVLGIFLNNAVRCSTLLQAFPLSLLIKIVLSAKNVAMKKALLLNLICVLFVSCGYRLGNLHRSMPDKHDHISVPTFKNSTMEVGVEKYFTNSMLSELIRADFVKVVDQSKAQAVLEGTIVSVKYTVGGSVTNESLTTLPNNTVLNSSYELNLVVHLRLRRTSDQAVIWSNQFSGSKTVWAAQIGTPGQNSANPVYDYSAKQFAVNELSKSMMSEAYSRMTEGF